MIIRRNKITGNVSQIDSMAIEDGKLVLRGSDWRHVPLTVTLTELETTQLRRLMQGEHSEKTIDPASPFARRQASG